MHVFTRAHVGTGLSGTDFGVGWVWNWLRTGAGNDSAVFGCDFQFTCLCWYQSFGRNISPRVMVLVSCERTNRARKRVEGLNSSRYQNRRM